MQRKVILSTVMAVTLVAIVMSAFVVSATVSGNHGFVQQNNSVSGPQDRSDNVSAAVTESETAPEIEAAYETGGNADHQFSGEETGQH